MSLSTQPYKGARDFYPEDKRRQDFMFSTIRRCVKSFGYEEYDAPILEPLDLYIAKSGEELVNEQTYSFIDRGGRSVAIRPEMTPTVSRMVAKKYHELTFPIRWFSIPNLWRYERPQRGRLREHWQLNVDIFGVQDSNAELELIMVSDAIFKAFKAGRSMYEIRINHRRLMDYIFEKYLGLDKAQAYSMAKLIDRRAKMDSSMFLAEIDAVFTPGQRENGASEKLLAVLDSDDIKLLPDELLNLESLKELESIIDKCLYHGIDNVTFDISIMRGFDYYNGIVFEIFDKHPDNNRSMMGGGRYDGLVGLFGIQPVPTAGFGLGDATLANFLELHGLMPELKTETDIYLIPVGDNIDGCLKAAKTLREMNVNVAVDLTDKKLGDRIRVAHKMGIRYVLIVGKKELDTDQYTLRDVESSVEEKHSLERIVSLVLDRRTHHI